MDRLWAMQVFVQVVEAGSFSRGARQLDLANASVTSCIRNLESHVGVTLLQRTTRHLHVTEEGAAFYDQCKSILALVDEAEAGARGAKGELRGTLRIETPFAIGHSILSPILVDFSNRNPSLRIIVTLTNQVDNMVGRGIDVAIRMGEVEDAGLVARSVYEGKYVVCASPEFLRKHGIPSDPRAIKTSSCLGLTATQSGSPREWVFKRGAEEHRLTPEGKLFFNSSDALIHTAIRGAGMIYVLDILAQEYLRRGDLQKVLGNWETERRTFYVAYPKSHFISPKVRAFTDYISSVLDAPGTGLTRPVKIRSAAKRS